MVLKLGQSASAIGTGIDIDTRPPCSLITVPVKLAMVRTENRNRETCR
jgi:hypothetical protein